MQNYFKELNDLIIKVVLISFFVVISILLLTLLCKKLSDIIKIKLRGIDLYDKLQIDNKREDNIKYIRTDIKKQYVKCKNDKKIMNHN